MCGRTVIGILTLLCGLRSASAGEIFVDVTNLNDALEDGSAGHPFDRIQEGIIAAADGDVVWVLPGVYRESLSYLGKDIRVRSTDGAEVTAIESPVIGGSCVNLDQGEPLTAEIRGFELRNADAIRGGGVFVYFSSATIADNIIRGNRSDFGAGIDVEYGSAVIIGNLIEDNDASDFDLRHIVGDGGGIGISDSNALIINNIVRNNYAERRGGGISVLGNPESTASVVICAGNLLYGNSADGLGGNAGGGGLSVRANAQVTVDSCTITGNTSVLADGVHVTFPDTVVEFDNCIIHSNGGTSLPEVRVDLAAAASLQYCAISGGAGGVQTASLGSVTLGAGILNVDPMFVSVVGGDFRLSPCSPLVNAGDPLYQPHADETSLDGAARIAGGRIDIGAYERLQADCNVNGVDDACDIASGVSEDGDGDGVPDECGEACPGDVNGDASVGLADLAILLTHFGTASGAERGDGDLDGDGDVDLADLARLLAVFGSVCR